MKNAEEDHHRTQIQDEVLTETLTCLTSKQTWHESDASPSANACCVICLSDISEPSTAQPCGHRNFDYICLTNWMSLNPTCPLCPLCKVQISEVHYDFKDHGQTWKSFKIPKWGGLERSQEQSRSGRTEPVHRSSFSNPNTFMRRYMARTSRGREGLSLDGPVQLDTQDAVERRRDVYRQRTYSLHIGSNSASRYREVNPAEFNASDTLQSRARAWIRRELQVFEFLDSAYSIPRDNSYPAAQEATRCRRRNNPEFVMEYVIATLKTVDIQSAHAEELLTDFLGRETTKLFLHELRNFLRSPYSVGEWDRHVQYHLYEARPSSSRSGRSGRRSTLEDRSSQRVSRSMASRPRPLSSCTRARRSLYNRYRR